MNILLHEKAVLLPNFFFTDWRHEHLKNKIDLLFYREHFYGFSESDMGVSVRVGAMEPVENFLTSFLIMITIANPCSMHQPEQGFYTESGFVYYLIYTE